MALSFLAFAWVVAGTADYNVVQSNTEPVEATQAAPSGTLWRQFRKGMTADEVASMATADGAKGVRIRPSPSLGWVDVDYDEYNVDILGLNFRPFFKFDNSTKRLNSITLGAVFVCYRNSIQTFDTISSLLSEKYGAVAGRSKDNLGITEIERTSDGKTRRWHVWLSGPTHIQLQSNRISRVTTDCPAFDNFLIDYHDRADVESQSRRSQEEVKKAVDRL